MEEIVEKISNELDEIRNSQSELKDIEDNGNKLQEELKELKEERNKLSDKKSGFYKDISEKVNEKDSEFREVNSIRMQKEKELEKIIQNKKEEILKYIQDKKQYIDENRNVDLNGVKEEKRKIERELELNSTTKEEFEKMSDSEKAEVRKAKENYLNNKHRLKEITPKIEFMEFLDGKEPRDKYLELDNLEKNVDDNFDKNNLDKVDEILAKESKENWYSEIGFEEALEEAQKNKVKREENINNLKEQKKAEDEKRKEEKNKKEEAKRKKSSMI